MKLAVTLGDPRGIGPEVVAKAVRQLLDRRSSERSELILIGPNGTGAEGLADHFIPIGDWDNSGDLIEAGRLAGRSIERATELALSGEVAGIVTAPIDKAALNLAGYSYPGHTEMLAELAGAPEVAMMMVTEETPLGGPLRIILATTHIPLAEVPTRLTIELISGQARLAAHALERGWALTDPKIAVCALNPHASDGGLFGDEEARVLEPAVEALSAEGYSLAGPIPADTIFLRALGGEFDLVIVPYHDLGMAVFKTISFGRGVNLTVGLPFVRTSPDHGTAIGIAGSGRADPRSMVAAIELAERLGRNWGSPQQMR